MLGHTGGPSPLYNNLLREQPTTVEQGLKKAEKGKINSQFHSQIKDDPHVLGPKCCWAVLYLITTSYVELLQYSSTSTVAEKY